jgi:hypothetical protein
LGLEHLSGPRFGEVRFTARLTDSELTSSGM